MATALNGRQQSILSGESAPSVSLLELHAVALAASGNLTQARQVAAQAIRQAKDKQQGGLAEQIQERLQGYGIDRIEVR